MITSVANSPFSQGRRRRRRRTATVGRGRASVVRRVLEDTGGKRVAATWLLGISYPTLRKRLREQSLDDAETSVRASAAPRAPRAD